MTGFGRGEFTDGNRTFIVEIKAVNHRYNDISIRMPRFLNSLEDKIRESILSFISRGKIDLYISYSSLGTDNKNIIFDEPLAQEYYNILDKLKMNFNLSDTIGLSLITRFPDIIKVENKEEDQEVLWKILSQALKLAVENLIKMRKDEGARLKYDIDKRLIIISDIVKNIESRTSLVIEEYRTKLNNRIKDLMQDYAVDEQRLAMEVAIMSDKSSITEEIVRLNSHIQQMKSTLELAVPIGRKLDFIVQELNREANTISSKSFDIEIINNVVEIKSELEKIREQIQNIE